MRTEVDLCKPLIERMLERHWNLVAELEIPGVGRADLAFRQGEKIWIVEAKLRLSWTLVMQAFRWVGAAHRVSILIPRGRSRPQRL